MELNLVDDEKRIQELERKMEAAAAAGDTSAVVPEFYAADAKLLAPGAPIAIGHDAITATFNAMTAMGVKSVELNSTDIDGDGDTVWSTGTYKLQFETPDGTIEDVGKFANVFRRQSDGSLKCVIDAFNSDLPPPGQ